MADRKNFNTTRAPKMSEFFSQAVIAGDYIFLSGTAGLNPDSGKIISDDFEEQTRQCFLNIKTILEEAGSSVSKGIKTTIFMIASNDFSIINKVYYEFFRKIHLPVSCLKFCPFLLAFLFQLNV